MKAAVVKLDVEVSLKCWLFGFFVVFLLTDLTNTDQTTWFVNV